jgi:periplasmic protein TonB
MDSSKILSADVLDLLFDKRNKDYGAYELRKSYKKRIMTALWTTGTIALLAVGGSVLAGSIKDKKPRYTIHNEVVLQDFKPDEPEKLPEPIQKPVEQVIKTEQFTAPKIVDEDVPDPPPTQEELSTAKIDVFSQDGEDDPLIPKVPEEEKQVFEEKKKEVSDEIFTTVQVPARYPGNWENFLRRNLNEQTPVDNGAPPGRYTVTMKFVVDKDGKVSNVQALSSNGYGVEEEAARVLKKAVWEPAIQGGYKVKAYHTQVIVFIVPEE